MRSRQIIAGGTVVTPSEIIENGTVVIEDGKIVEVDDAPRSRGANAEWHDARGAWVLPGLVDTHSDAIELELEPRPNCTLPLSISFAELERKLAGQGITTIHHALCLLGDEGESVRSNDRVGSLIRAIRQLTRGRRLIRHYIHLRFEITNRSAVPLVEQLIEGKVIDLLSFTDHTPGQGQLRDFEVQVRLTRARDGLSDEQARQQLKARMNLPKIDPSILEDIAAKARKRGIPIASHDDDSIEKLDVAESWHASICEFPVSLPVAIEAKRRGLLVAMGAPNVLLGRSHSNNVSALEALRHGAVDILCSDYYPPSLIQSVFALFRKGFDMRQAVNLVSYHPARALGMAEAVGSISPGKVADVLIVREDEGTPVIEKVFVGGVLACQMTYQARGVLEAL
ncbi:alpha-D-ribose 1-methylphosphonate 5-triphosphate diphosphatase [Kyrpidia sp.]|uniref:alpha-D-ribose 1-methylphosphonate 5-triphosphate diphosphatase n=1 Tax=Kyrpidia sp. TaxID=2073077 RepID=UPI0025855D8D|nr:alpha-D-ribose 1-methylphosphonate 5-triphosphate diphosphatase [Kyrpidia sp.]MCL6576926.1 alpha-D-ribose 1-methylphosphonate 5-triphosphate diphosphatase [Kyrpidia sp.]